MLLKLPYELLAMVVEFASPYIIEDLSLTCKKLHDSLQPLLKKHNELRKAYRNFSFPVSGVKVSDLLARIAADPIIAAYIVHLDLSMRVFCSDRERADDKYMKEMTDKLRPLVLGSPHLSELNDGDDELDVRWLRGIVQDGPAEDGNVEFCIPFLMSLLTNVETLSLPEDWCFREIFTASGLKHPATGLLRLLVAKANDANLTNQPLQELRAIRPTHEDAQDVQTDMESLFPFLALDSLQELDHYLGVCGWDQPCNMPFEVLGSNLEVLKLKCYCISGEHAEFLFRHMQRLRVMELQYPLMDGDECGFQADTFMRFLMKGTFETLERLVLLGRGARPGTGVLDCSLRKFSRLKYLELDTTFLDDGIGAPDFANENSWKDYATEARESSGEGECGEGATSQDTNGVVDDEPAGASNNEDSVPEGEVRAYHDDHGVDNIIGSEFHPGDERKEYPSGKGVWRLVSVLPESLETLILHTPAAPRNSDCIRRMFWRFEQLRVERLSNLQRVEVYVYEPQRSSYKPEGWREEAARLRSFFDGRELITKFMVLNE